MEISNEQEIDSDSIVAYLERNCQSTGFTVTQRIIEHVKTATDRARKISAKLNRPLAIKEQKRNLLFAPRSITSKNAAKVKDDC